MAARLLKSLRFTAPALLLALIAWAETRQPVAWFRLLSFAFGFAFLASLAWLARGRLRDGLTMAASLAFGLCLLEGAANLIENKVVLITTPGWTVYEPVLGWGPGKPGTYHSTRLDPKTGATIYSADYTFDSALLRQTVSAPGGRSIVFFGDSFTFGFGLDDADAMPQVFADLLQRRQRVLNLANGGYSPQQFLRMMETGFRDGVIGPDPALFIFLTAAFHAERTACKPAYTLNAPRYVLENGALAFRGRCYEGARLRLRQFLLDSAAWRSFVEPYRQSLTRADVELYLAEVSAAVKLAREKYGVETLIPYLRSSPGTLAHTGFTEEDIMRRLGESGALVFDAGLKSEDGAPLEIAGDGHPTALANRLRAELIKSYIAQHISGINLSRLE